MKLTEQQTRDARRSGLKHKEAFCIMKYASEDRTFLPNLSNFLSDLSDFSKPRTDPK